MFFTKGELVIWDAKSGQSLKTLKGHSDDVLSVCWSPDGKYLASGASDKTVRIWGVE
jgi:WD40 repeat protein